mgnify:CR=1 FL=1
MIGIIADIHANLPALQSVLDKLQGAEAIYCAGDIVGYGPYPAEVLEIVKEEGIISVMGNHDYAVIDQSVLPWFNPLAREAIRYTARVLSPEHKSYLLSLPWKIDGEFLMVHGSLRDPLFEYLLPGALPKTSKLTIIGHTHIQFFEGLWLNPGSVGQPRDGDPRAAFAVFDPEKGKIKLKRTSYNIDEVAEEILRVNLPKFLADRLYEGI